MNLRLFHILLLASLFCMTGCNPDYSPVRGENNIKLTVFCDENPRTKVDSAGVDKYNENLIKTVDFFFYPGVNPNKDIEAAYHVRMINEDEHVPGTTSKIFDLVVKKNLIDQIFVENNGQREKATVYVLVNADEAFLQDTLEGRTSLRALANGRIETNFVDVGNNYVQPSFLMDGSATLEYNEDAAPNVYKDIKVTRFAAKLSVGVHVENTVILYHQYKEDSQGRDITEKPEVWTPVLHTLRIYLVDGVKTVTLSSDGETLPDSDAKDTGDADKNFPKVMSDLDAVKLPFVENDNITACVGQFVLNDSLYYDSYPMYSYPTVWSTEERDHEHTDYTKGLPVEPPYLKLEMDWRREKDNGYAYDLRKYYYKIFLPIEGKKFERNKWYNFLINVGILGSETDEGKAIITPSCYILDWQIMEQELNKQAVISAARYLSVDREWELHNVDALTIPFVSSHDVKIVENSVTARRPYYGESKALGYRSNLHARVVYDESTGRYFLEYQNQPQNGCMDFEPRNWFEEHPNSITMLHKLDNNYVDSVAFDYSPYTIEFDIVHADLKPTDPRYEEYKKHIKITQYPAIYIEALLNSDTRVIPKSTSGAQAYYVGSTWPYLQETWGYVYVNGRDQPYDGSIPTSSSQLPDVNKFTSRTRLIRWDEADNGVSFDPFFKLSPDNNNLNKKEYQWQTVWYTRGSRDIFNIHVTVLPEKSEFVIGDPRSDVVDTLAYDPGNSKTKKYENIYNYVNVRKTEGDYVLPASRTGFAYAPSLDDDNHPVRKLKWYYPTENTSRTKNMLAPCYRVASKFGGTEYGGKFFQDITMEYGQYRCAAYQEDGFPAGRWRLPTKAEIHFIAQLSAKGAFEFLFSNATYWSANGAVTVGGGTVTDSKAQTALLRCVYDSWYWDPLDDRLQGEQRSHFYWGDKER